MIDLLDLHTHSLASGHAYNSLYEMACSASKKGLSLYGYTFGKERALYDWNLQHLEEIIIHASNILSIELSSFVTRQSSRITIYSPIIPRDGLSR